MRVLPYYLYTSLHKLCTQGIFEINPENVFTVYISYIIIMIIIIIIMRRSLRLSSRENIPHNIYLHIIITLRKTPHIYFANSPPHPIGKATPNAYTKVYVYCIFLRIYDGYVCMQSVFNLRYAKVVMRFASQHISNV